MWLFRTCASLLFLNIVQHLDGQSVDGDSKAAFYNILKFGNLADNVPYEEGLDGYPAAFINITSAVDMTEPAQDTLPAKLPDNFTIIAIMKPVNDDGFLFSIFDSKNDLMQLAVRLVPIGPDISSVLLVYMGKNKTMNKKQIDTNINLKDEWIRVDINIERNKATLFVNCTEIKVETLTDFPELVFDEDSRLQIGRGTSRFSGDFQGFMQQLTIQTHTQMSEEECLNSIRGDEIDDSEIDGSGEVDEYEDIVLKPPTPPPPPPCLTAIEKGEKGEKGECQCDEKRISALLKSMRDEIVERGPPGPIGPPGISIKGDLGPKGDTGERGAVGMPGEKGEKGDTGDKVGDSGPLSVSNGEKGEKGEKGDKGSMGKQGSRGAQGKVGAQGPRGLKGSQGIQGPPGPPGEKVVVKEVSKDNSKVKVEATKGSKGDKGRVGSKGPQGPKGEKGAQGPPGEKITIISAPGLPGPPGPPGIPGVSIIGPKGEPGAVIVDAPMMDTNFNRNEYQYTSNEEFMTNIIIYQNIEILKKRGSSKPAGTMAYVLKDEALFIRSKRGWRYVSLGQDLEDTHTERVPRENEEESLIYSYNLISEMNTYENPVLRMVALNEPYTGDMYGRTNKACNRQALRAGIKGMFRTLVASRFESFRSIVKDSEYGNMPVVNIKGEVLFESWNKIVDGNGGLFLEMPKIYTFNGRDVSHDSLWPIKAVWTGMNNKGELFSGGDCKNWNSKRHNDWGIASSLNTNKLLGQEWHSCSEKLIVLCIETEPENTRSNKIF